MKSRRDPKNLCTRLRVQRALHGLSQREAAQEVGMSPWRYWRIEKGMCPPRPPELRALARVLGDIKM